MRGEETVVHQRREIVETGPEAQILVIAGMAAGIAAIFRAPLGGTVLETQDGAKVAFLGFTDVLPVGYPATESGVISR